MKYQTVFAIAILLLLSTQEVSSSYCTSSLKLFEAIEYARKNPNNVATNIYGGIMGNGKKRGSKRFRLASGGYDATCIQEGYDYSKRVGRVGDNRYSIGLSLASQYTVHLLYKIGRLDHNVGNQNPGQRCERFTHIRGYAENLAGTPKMTSGKWNCSFWVYLWIIDCGVPSRGHRNSLYDIRGARKYVGCYSDGRVAAMNMSHSVSLKSRDTRNYGRYGIDARYQGQVLPRTMLYDNFNAANFRWL